jgi:hypothetical protein
MPHSSCSDCGYEVGPDCICFPPDDRHYVDRVRLAYRSLTDPSVRGAGRLLPYHEAIEEVVRLDRLYTGKVKHFIVAADSPFA